MKQTKHILATIAMLLCSLAAKAEVSVEVIDIANNADAMLYTNAKCTNTSYGDQFAGWHVLFDNDPSTFFHSEYSNRDSDDGLDHYIRVDLGEGSKVKAFSFTYTVRGSIPNNGNYSPKRMIVEGANTPDGAYTKLATLNNLPSEGAAVYESPAIGNGASYRYIRFRVTETYYNTKIYGHPFFFMAEFGMMRVRIEGTCGNNLSWKLTDDNELVIEGTGDMDMYDYSWDRERAPWYEYRESIQTITIGEGVTSIGISAFEDCSNLTSITIPESVTSIGDDAFNGCYNLSSITIPESVTSIGDGTFSICSSLTAINIPESSQLTSIGSSAFYSCTSLTSITIPEGVTSIEDGAFYECNRLERLMINCANVGSWFSGLGLSSLKEIVLGEGVTSIGERAFSGRSSLTAITCTATTPPTIGGSQAFYSVDKSIPVYVPAGSVEAYKAAAYWSEFANFLALPTYVADITLGQSEAMLTEGETVTLTATVTPDDVTDKTLTWSSSDERVATVDAAGLVTALAPGTATITVAANDGSGVSASCVVTVKAKPMVRCAAPVMDYVDGQVVLTCETEGVEFVTDVVAEGAQRYQTSTFDLAAVYTITAYATKERYLDSDPVTLTLCWVPCTEEHEDDDTEGIITLPAKPVLIQTAGGVITLTGLPDGAEVAVYDTAGTSLAAATAENGTATLTTNLTTGSTAIVKIGGHSVKVVVK